MSRKFGTSLFEDAVDVPLWLETDGRTPFAERLRRDRTIARELNVSATAPVACVRGWWRRLERGPQTGPGRRLEAIRGLITLVMLGAGAVAGILVALAAFHYDGTHPVNVVRLLALLLAPQLLLVALTLLMALPARLPGLGPLQDALRALNPGALAAALFRRLAPEPGVFASLFGAASARSTAAGRFAKWQLIYWSQNAAAAFNLAALATGAVLIAFTDLAFGWGTTLAAEPAAVKRIVDAIALPWHGLAPGAVPDLELIERSQFFRLKGAGGFGTDASRTLAGWWSFTILAITLYGLLPRLLLLVLAAWRLQAATRTLLLEDPRVTALLDRMAAPEIETGGEDHDEAPVLQPAPRVAPPGRLSGSAGAVIWSQAIEPGAAPQYVRRRFGIEPTRIVEAGGGAELGADLEAAEAIARAAERTVLVLTPAWEPPLLEFLDFLAALRERAGTAVSIVVAPVGEREQQVSDTERDTWTHAIARLSDPHVYVETGAA